MMQLIRRYFERLKWRRVIAATLLAVIAITVVALIERGSSSGVRAATNALTGVAFGGLAPLLALGAFELGTAGSVDATLWPLARVGQDRRQLLLALAAAHCAALSAAFLLMGVTGVLAARLGSTDALTLLTDVAATSWVAVLAALAYGATTLAFGAHSRTLLWAFIVADWTLGSLTGFVGALLPRAHVRALLGGVPVFELPALGNVLALLLFAAMALLAGRRAVAP